MALTERDNISIAQIVIYLVSLAVAVLLSIRHGFGNNAAWLYLSFFSVIRIAASAVELTTRSQPTNEGLYIAYGLLQTIGLSPLILVQLSLLGRLLTNIRKNTKTILNSLHLLVVQMFVSVGLILSTVGSAQLSASDFEATSGTIDYPTIAKVGIILNIVGYVLLVLATGAIGTKTSHADAGEKRILLIVGLSLPFILVRLAYSAEAIISGNVKFSIFTGDANIMVGMCVVMEMIVVAITLSIGLTMQQVISAKKPTASRNPQMAYQQQGYPEQNV